MTKLRDKDTFRGLSDELLTRLKDERDRLNFILRFEKNYRKFIAIEIRKEYLDLYFLGNAVKIAKQVGKSYSLVFSKEFSPDEDWANRKGISLTFSGKEAKGYARISFEDINEYILFDELMQSVMAKIILHKKGNISEGVSEMNHLLDNRSPQTGGILVIDRQVIHPREKKRIDLLGLRKRADNKSAFVVIELKNKGNSQIDGVFTQTKEYIDIVNRNYEDFRATYEKVLAQKIDLGLLDRKVRCNILESEKGKDMIEGIVILDNFNTKSKRLDRALEDWEKIRKEPDCSNKIKLFLKSNVFDDAFLLDYQESAKLTDKLRKGISH